jgi:hypothetical protein
MRVYVAWKLGTSETVEYVRKKKKKCCTMHLVADVDNSVNYEQFVILAWK